MARKSWSAPARSCASHRTCRTKPGLLKIPWTWTFLIPRARIGSTKQTLTCAKGAERARFTQQVHAVVFLSRNGAAPLLFGQLHAKPHRQPSRGLFTVTE